MKEVKIKGKIYEYVVDYRNIKKVYIGFKDNKITVKVPKKTSEKEILKILSTNEELVDKVINNMNKKIRFTYENGSTIPFYGRDYKIIYSNESFIRGEFMYLDQINPKESFNKLAKKYGQKFYRDRINYYIETFNLPYTVNQIVIREMKTRFGVCNIRDHKITFQLGLAVCPIECIDYIVVHELTHLKVANHSKDFYDEIIKIMPDYKYRIKKLKENY